MIKVTKKANTPKKIDVLGGYVELIDVMGTDHTVPNSARICTGGLKDDGTVDAERDRHLIRYLMRHQHTTPFEMPSLMFKVRCPMDVWRQWIRHRTASVNEYSTRYNDAIDEMHTTDGGAWRKASDSKRQGCSDECFDVMQGVVLSHLERDFHDHARSIYKERLRMGVAREQARKDLPLSTYTEAIWKIDLHNLFHFLRLRMAPDAQYEIRQYANAVAELTSTAFPECYDAFMDFQRNAVMLSSLETSCLASMFHTSEEEVRENWCDRYGTKVDRDEKCSEREEFISKLKEIGVING